MPKDRLSEYGAKRDRKNKKQTEDKQKKAEKKALKKETATDKATKLNKVTKGTINKEKRVQHAIAESLRVVSAISLDRKEEDKLLDLMAMLEGVTIEKPRVQFSTRPEVKVFERDEEPDKEAVSYMYGVVDSAPAEESEEGEETDEGSGAETGTGPSETGSVEASDSSSDDSDSSSSDDSSDSEDSDGESESSKSESESGVADKAEGTATTPAADADAASDSSTDDDTLPAAENASLATVIGRQTFIRKIIRDERRFVREQQQAQLLQPSAERVVSRLKLSLQSASETKPAGAVVGGAAVDRSDMSSAYRPHKDPSRLASPLPPPGAGKVAKKPISATVRVQAYFDKSGDGKGKTGAPKLLVMSRAAAVPDVVEMVRGKFKATATTPGGKKTFKYDAVRVVSTGELLSAFTLLDLADDEALTLFSSAQDADVHAAMTRAAETTAESTSAASAAVASANHLPSGQEVPAPSTPVAAEKGSKTATPSYWTPPPPAASRQHSSCSADPSRAQDRDNKAYNAAVKAELTALYKASSYEPIREQRKALPIFNKRADLLAQIAHNQVTVVSGETGSGKTTQLPLYLMEDMIKGDRASECNIVCTQPRRIAAVSVAERVHYESAQPGPVGSGLVGYQVRLDSRVSAKTKLTYCTTGVLLRRLQDPQCLAGISHVILDEVHERGVESDFLMTLLKRQAPQFPSLKIVLMSATMKEELFSAYFDKCPIVYVSGRMFPVHQHYIAEALEVVAQGQHILAAERGRVSNYNADAMDDTYDSILVPTPGAAARGKMGPGAKGPGQKVHALRDPSIVGARGNLDQRAPGYNPDLVAELVIRIITTQAYHGSRTGVSTSTFAAPGPATLAALAPPPAPVAAPATKLGGRPAPGNRLGKIQAAAAKSRTEQTASTPAVIPLLSQTSAPIPPPVTTAGDRTAAAPHTGEAILVFLSGVQAINKVSQALRQRGVLQKLKAQVYVLHGMQSAEQQRKVFRRTAPGEWKIVLTTNIAETSITVDDVTHVIDTGFAKEVRFDPASGISSLQEVVESRVAARQRAGRAGRVRAGHCWRLFSEEFFLSPRMDEHPLPEIQRVPLEEVVLQVLLLRLGKIKEFLGECMEPPSTEQVHAAVACLIEIGAVLPLQEMPLTALGYHLARMPMDVRIGKMLIYASLLECVEPVLTIAAALGGKSPFITPMQGSEKDDALRSHQRFLVSYYHDEAPPASHLTGSGVTFTPAAAAAATPVNCYSDHIALVNAYNQWRHILQTQGAAAAYRFCQDRYLAPNVMRDIQALREQFRAYLRQTGFVGGGSRRRGGGDDGQEEEDSRELDFGQDDDADQDVSEGKKAGAGEIVEGDLTDGAGTALTARVVDNLVRCVLCAGLYPQIVRLGRFRARDSKQPRSGGRGAQVVETIKLLQADKTEVSLHPSSLLSSYTKAILDRTPDATEGGGVNTTGPATSHYGLQLTSAEARPKDAYLVYHKKMALTKLFLFDCTVVPHAAVLLFSNNNLVWNKTTHRVTVGGWIEMKISELHCILYRRLQREIEGLLRTKVEDASADISARQRNLVHILSMLTAE